MFELISIERGDFWISSVNLVKMLKDSGIADKQHYNVIRDIDRMYETNQRMVAKYGGVNADGSRKGADVSCEGGSEVPGMYQSTYTDQQNQERRCWMLSKPVAIALISSYSFLFSLKISNMLLGIDTDLIFEKREKIQKTYFIFNPMTNMIKIGKSNNVKRRMNELSTQSGCKLELLHVLDEDVELELHAKFKHIRHHGEWFYDDGQIREFICSEYQ